MKVLAILLPYLLTCVSLLQAQELASQIQKAEFLITHHQSQTTIPGVQVAVIWKDELLWSKAFGYADIDQKTLLKTSTPMRVASVSKSMTSLTLGKLVEDGVLDLDEDIRTYVPEFPDKGSVITARHLASSTSGIRHYTSEDPDYNQVHYLSVVEALSPFKNDPLLFEPGSDYLYSSYGWVLLSVAIERASGTSFQKLMTRTWAELDMHNSYLDHPIYHPEKISKQYVLKKQGLFKRLFSSNEAERITAQEEDRNFMYAGGGYLSTAEDLATMGWKLLSDDYLNASTREILFQDQKLTHGEHTRYGLGWEVGQSRMGTPVVFHSGSMNSARSHLVIYPKHNVVFAIVMNTGDNVFFNDREAHSIAELFFPDEKASPPQTSVTGEWEIKTTSLRDKKTKGKLILNEDSTGIVSGEITFARSRKKDTYPIVLAGQHDKKLHLISISPMFIDLYLTFNNDSFSGEWLHDFNVKGVPESDPYWKPRSIEGKKMTE